MAEEKIRYICPVCDAEISAGARYCRHCRSRIRAPLSYTGGLLPNERKTGDSTFEQAPVTQGGRNLAGKNMTGKNYTYRTGASGSTGHTAAGQSSSSQSGGKPKKKNSGCLTLIIVIILLYLIFSVLFGIG